MSGDDKWAVSGIARTADVRQAVIIRRVAILPRRRRVADETGVKPLFPWVNVQVSFGIGRSEYPWIRRWTIGQRGVRAHVLIDVTEKNWIGG